MRPPESMPTWLDVWLQCAAVFVVTAASVNSPKVLASMSALTFVLCLRGRRTHLQKMG